MIDFKNSMLLYLGPVSEELPTSNQQLSNFTCFNSPNCFKQDGMFKFTNDLLFVVILNNETF